MVHEAGEHTAVSTRQSSVVRWRIALVSNFIVTVLCGAAISWTACSSRIRYARDSGFATKFGGTGSLSTKISAVLFDELEKSSWKCRCRTPPKFKAEEKHESGLVSYQD